MSLRYGSRVAYQMGVRAMQVAKDRAATFKSLGDASSGSKSRHFNSNSEMQRRRRAESQEESLRKVMFLSCWGPN